MLRRSSRGVQRGCCNPGGCQKNKRPRSSWTPSTSFIPEPASDVDKPFQIRSIEDVFSIKRRGTVGTGPHRSAEGSIRSETRSIVGLGETQDDGHRREDKFNKIASDVGW